MNLRDQHDAVEFLNTVVDSVDEALKSLNLPQICSKVLGGTFADQKICKDCPHRYSREEDFTLLSVDIRHSQNLKESLEQYVIGELLDGPNAYFCEKCNKKVIREELRMESKGSSCRLIRLNERVSRNFHQS